LIHLTRNRFKLAKKAYNQKKKNKTNTEEDDIMMLKLEKEELSRMRANKAVIDAEVAVQMEEMGEDQDDSMFIQDDTPAPGPSTNANTSKGKGKKRKLAETVGPEGEDSEEYAFYDNLQGQ
jgi:hypothetical protein